MKKILISTLIFLTTIFSYLYWQLEIKLNATEVECLYYKNYSEFLKNAPAPAPAASPVYTWKSNFDVYVAENKKLPPPHAKQKRVVFFGDSLTFNWDLKKYFSTLPIQCVNRGNGGDETGDMLARYMQDAINLKPTALVILAGTTNVMSFKVSSTETISHLNLMCELARCRKIKVFLGTIPPALESTTSEKDDLPNRRDAYRNAVNQWIKNYCGAGNCHLLDYYKILSDPMGRLDQRYALDHVHLTEAGYEQISPTVKKSLSKYLR